MSIPNHEGTAAAKRIYNNYIRNPYKKSHHHILSTYIDTNSFHFHLKILPSNQKQCHENNICRYIHKDMIFYK